MIDGKEVQLRTDKSIVTSVQKAGMQKQSSCYSQSKRECPVCNCIDSELS